MNSVRFEIYKDKANEWRWRARAGNGEIVADGGKGYDSKANVKRAVLSLCQAVVYGVGISPEIVEA